MNSKIAALLAIFITSCTGTVSTTKLASFEAGTKVEGIIYYGYKVVPKRVAYDRIRNPNTGEITNSVYEDPASDRYCAPQVVFQNVVEPDYAAPFLVSYDSGWFETSKFSVALKDGMLQSVNTEATPGLTTAVEALQGIATLREDILDGFVAAADRNNTETIQALNGQPNRMTPITCTTNL